MMYGTGATVQSLHDVTCDIHAETTENMCSKVTVSEHAEPIRTAACTEPLLLPSQYVLASK